MEKLFVLVGDNFEWEDIIVYTDEQEAKFASIKYPEMRIEIFTKTLKGFHPSYSYYVNGVLLFK